MELNKLLAAIPFLTTAQLCVKANEPQALGYEKRGKWDFYDLDSYQFTKDSILSNPVFDENGVNQITVNNITLKLLEVDDVEQVKNSFEEYGEMKQYIWVKSKSKDGILTIWTDYLVFLHT